MKKEKKLYIKDIEKPEYSVYLNNDKDIIKYIKRIERIIRSSTEYRDYIAFLKEYVDMTACTFFNKVNSAESRRIHVEIHHEPLTLMDIVSVVLTKWIDDGTPLNDLLIADEVMELHYRNLVGLVPLSKTVHETIHSGNQNAIIPLYVVYGNYREFILQYEDYISDDIVEKLQRKIAATKAISDNSFSLYELGFETIEVDGVELLQKIGTDGENKDQ